MTCSLERKLDQFLLIIIHGCLKQGKFGVAPTVLVTAEHISSAFKHNAASLWVENATSSSFYICLRELQNYDGLHEDIFVV